jgi:hypothetical protein
LGTYGADSGNKRTASVSTTSGNNRQKGLKHPSRRRHEDKILQKIKMSSQKRCDDVNSMRNVSSQSKQQSRYAASSLQLDEEMDSWISPNIPTFNSFGYLSPEVAVTDNPTQNTTQNSTAESSAAKDKSLSAAADVNKPNNEKSKIIRPKPIYIKDKKYSDILDTMKSLKIAKYSIKIISGGIKLSVEDVDSFKIVKTYFAAKEIEFYTYDLADEKTFKVVLYGLPVFECSEVLEFLKEVNIHPKEVKKLHIKKTRYEDDAIYLISFPNGSTNMNDLRKVRYINYISISWAHYVRRGNITQCRRCQQFSHGTRNCYIQPKCVKCGEAHLSDKCPHEQLFTANEKALKCANCKESHPANYSNCSVRLNYIEYRKQLTEREKSKHQYQRSSRNSNNYSPRNNNHSGFSQPIHSHSQHENNHQTFSQQPPTRNAWFDNDRNLAATFTSNKNDLFTPKEIVLITNDIFSKMTKCRNKIDQIALIAEVVAKYVFNG